MTPYISIVIPVFNEEDNIINLWQRLYAVLNHYHLETKKIWEVIFIDDGSKDQSLNLLKAIASQDDKVLVIEFNRNYGQHAAILSAFNLVKGQIVITMDADLQNPPEEIPKLIDKIEQGFDIVSGWRQQRLNSDSLFKVMTSKIVNILTKKIAGIPISDYGCTLRAYKYEIINAMILSKEYNCLIPILANSFAKKTTEIPVKYFERAAGISKYNFWKLVNIQLALLANLSTIPLQMLNISGVIISIFSTCFGIALLIFRLFDTNHITNSNTVLFAILFFIIGIQFIIFSIIGECIGNIHQEVRNKPRYVIKNIYNLLIDKNC